MTMHRRNRATFLVAAICTIVLTWLSAGALAGEVNGTIAHRGNAIPVRYAYLVKGPDSMDPKTIVRKIILSATDLEAKIRACATMSCADSDLNDGMTIDFDAGPRLNYWVVRNRQTVQYSGTAPPTVFAATRNEPTHLAGTLSFDSAGSGGPKVELRFDAALLKEFTAAR